VKGLIVNKFRGEKALFRSEVDFLEMKTGLPVLGVIPYLNDMDIAQEDSVYLDEIPRSSGQGLNVVIIRVPHTACYDDYDPLQEMGCHLKYVDQAAEVGRPDLLILPGTKSTCHDMLFLKEQGLDRVILNLASQGVPVIGICGGLQMLGKTIRDPQHVESANEQVESLGLLPIETVFESTKNTAQVKARITTDRGLLKGLEGCLVSGYEIHMGQTVDPEAAPVCRVYDSSFNPGGYFDGGINASGLVFGTYLHGIFGNAEFTQGLLKNLWEMKGQAPQIQPMKSRDQEYDKLAEAVRANLDMGKVYEILGISTKKQETMTKQ
jgi:adenosylcobyric acid synthase